MMLQDTRLSPSSNDSRSAEEMRQIKKRMTFGAYRQLILSDLYRITGNTKAAYLLGQMFFGEAYKYIFWMRTCAYAWSHIVLRIFVFPLAYLMLRHYTYKFGISIPFMTNIGSGLYIGHFGCIVVNVNAVVGKNCNLSQGVTLGQANRGKKKGYPIVGDNVYIGPGAKIIGAVTIGNNVAIGANCVVTKDMPDDAVVVGIPGRVISYEGSTGYINRTEYM